MKNFENPGREFRPVPFWSYNDKLYLPELKRQIDAMQAAGYGGFFMHSRVGLVTKYLSPEWLNCLREAALYGEKKGLNAWLYDEDMWPSGYASGIVPATNDLFKERALVLLAESELRKEDMIIKEVKLSGRRQMIVQRVCSAGCVRFNGQCYIDSFNPNAIDCFLNSTHEKYRSSMGDCFSNVIKGIFTDEACYGIYWFYDHPHVPYSEYLRARILKVKNYDILDCCEQLFFDVGDYCRVRYDYYSQAGKQLCETFMIRYSDWCKKNRIKLTGHLMAEETFYEQVQWTGGVMPFYEFMDIPGVDKLFRENRQLVTIKQMTSVAEQLNKERALCECFAGLGHESGFLKRKQIIDWQAILGINFINMHLSHYSMRGERKRDYPPNIFYQQPYFRYERYFSDYAARLSQVAAYGKRECSVLIVCPLGAVCSEYNPNDMHNASMIEDKYDKPFYELSCALAAAQIDFHYGDETILSRHAKIKEGLISIGDYSYDIVILPNLTTMTRATEQLLSKFLGRLYVLGEKPVMIEGRKEEIPLPYLEFSKISALVKELQLHKKALIEIDGDSEEIIGCKRVGQEGNLYLFSNIGDSIRSFRLRLPHGERYLLSLSQGCASQFFNENPEIYLYPSGSLCIWETNQVALKQADIPIADLPPISSDGAVLKKYEKREIEIKSAVRTEENALPIEYAELFVSGKRITNRVHLSNIWHRHFYRLPEGTPFQLRYTFEVGTIPEGPLFAVIECAENYDNILLNGIKVTPLRHRGAPQTLDATVYTDISFSRCLISGLLKEGENILVLEGKKVNNITDVCCHRPVEDFESHQPTEAEAVYIIGDFSLEPIGDGFRIIKNYPIEVGNVATQGCPFYSGGLTYECGSLHGEKQLLIEGDFVYAAVELGEKIVLTGGNPCVITVPENYANVERFSITLVNSLFALLGPHHIDQYDELLWVDPGVFNDTSRYCAQPIVKPYGLVKISAVTDQ